MSRNPLPGLEAADLAIDALPVDGRQRLAALWLRRSTTELAASGIFAGLVQDLFVEGAPENVLELAVVGPADELRHARICHAMAGRYAGRRLPFPATPSPVVPRFGATQAEGRLLRLFVSFAVNECATAANLALALEQCESELARAAVRSILEDEVRHGRIGWAYLACPCVTPSRRDRLAQALPGMLEMCRSAWRRSVYELPDGPSGHGVPSQREMLDVFDGCVRDMVLPGLAELGVDPSRGERWLARQAD